MEGDLIDENEDVIEIYWAFQVGGNDIQTSCKKRCN
jgi:hypothetical protein